MILFATYSYKQTNNICYHEFTDMYSHSHPYRHYFYYAGYTMTTGNIRRKINLPFCCFSYFQPLYLHNTLMRDAKYPLNGWRTKRKIRVYKDGVTYKFIPNDSPMGNYNFTTTLRRYPNKLGKYTIHCGWKKLKGQMPILAEGNPCNYKSQAETSQKIM